MCLLFLKPYRHKSFCVDKLVCKEIVKHPGLWNFVIAIFIILLRNVHKTKKLPEKVVFALTKLFYE